MSSIGSIFSAKELAQTFQPLLLVELQTVDGNYYRFSTHALSSGYNTTPISGSYEYAGVPWIPRVLNQDIGSTQAMSDLGVDIPPQVTILLADPDKTLFSVEQTVGFKGAIVKLYSVMWDSGNLSTGSFSSDLPAPIKFIGTCSPGTQVNQRTISIVATSLLNLTQQQMPPIRIQPLCAWSFPPTAAARLDALSNSDSNYFQCGYSPDQTGSYLGPGEYGNGGYQYPRGNFESGTACFTNCDLSFAACIERLGNTSAPVPILQDNSNRMTGRFGGFDFVPIQNVGLQRPFSTGQWELIINSTNEARYGDYVPLCYGTTWIEPEVMGVYSDGNYTRFEALLCFGVTDQLLTCVVNGDVVPQYFTDYANPNVINSPGVTTSAKDNFWVTLNNGGLNGRTNAQVGWSNKGDCYGSYSAIAVQCLSQLAAINSLPQCQVLLQAGFVRTYSTPTTFTYKWTDNPAWILLDLMVIQAAWRYSDINIQSFIDAAAVCDAQIYFNSIDGIYTNVYNESNNPEYHRYSVGFTVKQRTPIGQVIQGVRNSMRGILYFDFNTGLLTLGNKQTLADQQPGVITGSNYNTAVASVTAAGVAANGYVAYSFDGGSIMRDSSGNSTLRITQKSNQELPNKVTNYFFDRENQYSQDISTIIDIEDVNRINAEVTGAFNLVGPQTFDHVNRVTATWFAENYRGNPRLDYEGSFIGDTGGTLQFDFETSVKAIHLMVGQLCFISDAQSGISMQLVRITRIQPSVNFETAKITALWHNDNWYQDTYGQGANQPIYKNPMSAGNLVPRSWRPGYETPDANDAYYSQTDKSFAVGQFYGTAADLTAIAQVPIIGQIPVNSFPSIPLSPQLEVVGVGDTGGGYESSTSYFVGISGLSASFAGPTASFSMSPMSNICPVALSSSQNALDVVVQGWPESSSGYFAFVGLSPNSMTCQFSSAVESSFIHLVNSYQDASWGAPDQAFSQLLVNIRKEIHAGVLGAEVLSVTSNSITFNTYQNYGFGVNQFAGREVVVLGVKGNPANPVMIPIANFTIASNTYNTLVLTSGNPTTCVYGNSLNPGDAVAIRFLPTFGSDAIGNYFEDLQLINIFNNVGTLYAVVGAMNASPIVVSLLNVGGTFPISVGQFVVVQGILGNVAANGGFYVSAVDPVGWTITLASSAGSGAYTSGGTVAIQTQGLNPGDEAGLVAFIIAGTGKGTYATIANNTNVRYYITGQWPVTPDPTTRLVILDSVITAQTLASKISNSNPFLINTYAANVLNFGRTPLFLQVQVQSAAGTLSPSGTDPFREAFLYGSAGALSDLTDVLIAY